MSVDLARITGEIKPVAEGQGFELIQVQWTSDPGGSILRVLIDREGGIQVGDCEKFSREIDNLLVVEGGLPGRYRLEVSSPGMNRPLVKEADYVRFCGKKVVIRTIDPIDGRRNYKGLIQRVEDQAVMVTIDGIEYKIPFQLIEKAHLVFE